ncbi:MAG: glycosyltransferase family 4 protein [Verrucomicrobia bacterium]|nr:glycosyltransferase family 4 protein [Verrucomicrobiota bacterium]
MQIVIAHAARTPADLFGEVFQQEGWLRRYLIWARTLPGWVRPEQLRNNLALGALRVAGPLLLSSKLGESYGYLLHPLFGRWAARHIERGDWILASPSYANEAFAKVRRLGGVTMLSVGNSHPLHYWEIMCEEHARWGVRSDPYLRSHQERVLRNLELSDYFFCASDYVRESYLAQGVAPERLFTVNRTFNPAIFKPPAQPRRSSTFRVVSPGGASLRKGTVYLFQAFEKLRREFKASELILTKPVREDSARVLQPYLPLAEWRDSMPHPELARFFQDSDVYVLASLEEGLARTGLEAMACGVPIIVTPHTGLNHFVEDGVNGFIVPIRDPQAIYEKLLLLATQPERRRAMGEAAARTAQQLNPAQFKETLLAAMAAIRTRETKLRG